MADMATPTAPQAPVRRGADWLDSWTPEDPENWDSGRAWKTLWVTTFNLTLAFATWFLVSALAPKLNNIGFDLSKGQLYWLVAMPGLAGGTPAPDLDVPAPDHGHPQAGARSPRRCSSCRPSAGASPCRTPTPPTRSCCSWRPGRDRRRRVLRVHALDLVLLPQGQAGHRPGPAGRHRQLRRQPRAVRHPVDRRASIDRRLAALHRCQEGRGQGGLVPERRHTSGCPSSSSASSSPGPCCAASRSRPAG